VAALDVHLADDEIRTLEEPYGPISRPLSNRPRRANRRMAHYVDHA